MGSRIVHSYFCQFRLYISIISTFCFPIRICEEDIRTLYGVSETVIPREDFDRTNPNGSCGRLAASAGLGRDAGSIYIIDFGGSDSIFL